MHQNRFIRISMNSMKFPFKNDRSTSILFIDKRARTDQNRRLRVSRIDDFQSIDFLHRIEHIRTNEIMKRNMRKKMRRKTETIFPHRLIKMKICVQIVSFHRRFRKQLFNRKQSNAIHLNGKFRFY